MKKLLIVLVLVFGSLAEAYCPEGTNEYVGLIVSVFDGDTFRADTGVGLGFWVPNAEYRLTGINAPEKKLETYTAAIISRDALRELMLNRYVLLCTERGNRGQDKKEKYGRYLVTVFLLEGTEVNAWMVEQGLAVYKEY